MDRIIVTVAPTEEAKEVIFWMAIRTALLLMVDAIERKLDLPRTAALRKQ